MFQQAGIPLPPPAQIALWAKTLGGVEPLVAEITRLLQLGLAGKNNPSAYVHRVVMKRVTHRRATAPRKAPASTAPASTTAATRRLQAARLAGLTSRDNTSKGDTPK